jgi:hypothetical protein
MTLRFIAAVNHLTQAKEQLESGQITLAQHTAMHEAALMRALMELASQCGIELVTPLQIDSIGEVNIVVKSEAGQSAQHTGCFGQAFVDHLNGFSPRTNLKVGTKLLPSHGRCHMSHLDVEKMVLAHYEKLTAIHR